MIVNDSLSREEFVFDHLGKDSWVQTAKANYREHQNQRGGKGVITQTTFGTLFGLMLDSDFKKYLSGKSHVNALIVGPGSSSGAIGRNPYEVYELAAYLEGNNINYDLTVTDLDERILDAVTGKKKFHISPGSAVRGGSVFHNVWDEFLSFVGEDKLIESDGRSYTVKIPDSVEQGLANGKIKTVEADVALMDKLDGGPYDFVICRNVLYQLPGSGQRLALYNLANLTELGNPLWVNDGQNPWMGNRLFSGLGGWLNGAWEDRLDIAKGEVICGKEYGKQERILHKK